MKLKCLRVTFLKRVWLNYLFCFCLPQFLDLLCNTPPAALGEVRTSVVLAWVCIMIPSLPKILTLLLDYRFANLSTTKSNVSQTSI